MAGLAEAMGLGGGSSKKAKLVADLTDEYRKLNLVLERTEQLSKNVANNLKTAGGPLMGGSKLGNAATPPPVPGSGGSGNFINPGDNSDLGFQDNPSNRGMKFAAFAKNVAKGLGIAGAAAMQAIDTSQFIENRVATTRFGFMGGGSGSAAFRGMMRAGTGTDPMDAARAAMAGMSYGMMPGLANYSSIAQSAATFSNLVPGAGLEGGMNAVAALNQGSNVNRLRMIGINVRDANTGLMRSFDDIANDLWRHLNSQKTGSGAITKKDLALSLQPGNSLDSLLNQYFGNDPVLRQGVVSVLMQKASGAGISKPELIATGALSDIANSIGQRNAASYGVVDAYTESGISGIIAANNVLIKASNAFEQSVSTFGKYVKGLSFLETLFGGGNGAVGGLIGGLMGLIGPMIGNLVGSIFSKIFGGGKGGGGTVAGGGKGGGLLAKGGGLLSRFLGGAAVYTGMEWLQGQLNKADVPDWLDKFGNFAFDTLQGGVTGLVAGKNPWTALLGAVAAGTGSLFNPYGEGGGEEAVMPLAGKPRVTSQFGVIRHLQNKDGSKSPTYGKAHGGIDYGVPVGTSVFAAKDGVVVETPFNANGLGNYIKIRHDDGYESLYGHLSQKLAAPGTRVSAGAVVGLSGNTGFSTGPHLHFQVQKNGQKVDPLAYISGAGQPSENGSAAVSGTVYESASGNLFGPQAISPLFASGTTGSLFGPTYQDTMVGMGGDNANSGGGTVINYGGVNVSIQVPNGTAINEEKLAREVKRILRDEEQLNKAVTR